MTAPGYHGRQNNEMFLNQPPNQDSNELVESLRINKRSSIASSVPSNTSQRTTSAQGQMNKPPSSSGSGTSYPMPALPYPDEPQPTGPPTASSRTNPITAPYPYPDVRRVNSPEHGRVSSPPQQQQDPYYRSGSAASDRSGTARGATGPKKNDRRGSNAVKPLPESPGPDTPDKDGYQRKHSAPMAPLPGQERWPAPDEEARQAFDRLQIREPSTVNRMSSTMSTATTRATRGSPPPPETPVMEYPSRPMTDIEARYAASGIGSANVQHPSMAAQQRSAAYAGYMPAPSSANPTPRPWTPTELPGSTHHPAPVVYQGPDAVPASQPVQQQQQNSYHGPNQAPNHSAIQDLRTPSTAYPGDSTRMVLPADEPPPAYSQLQGANASGQYPVDKQRRSTSGGLAATAAASSAGSGVVDPAIQNHPAFANDPDTRYSHQDPNGMPAVNGAQPNFQQGGVPSTPSAQFTPASPPPLPEGWIAHLDQNTGQYYYIHLPTQSTQWEFPKGPTPLNLNEMPMSPVATTYTNPLASPGLFSPQPLASPCLPMSPTYGPDSKMGFGALAAPQAFTGPPPSSGVELYKVAATNGVYFGPYLRYTNIDMERGLWLGSILLVTDAPQPPTIHVHQSTDLSPNPRQLKALNIHVHQRWTFFKYELDLKMDDAGSAKWTYAITSHLGCTRYEFLVAGRNETNWRFIATSGNDFSVNVNQNERARLGGTGYLWRDILQKHAECGGFHAQLGVGGQVNADRVWKEIPSLKQWVAISGKDNRKITPWTAAHEEDVTHAYFHYYTSHFDQPHLREAFAQIPHVMIIDDHDIFDRFGSYGEQMQFSNMFKNIGRIAIEMYLLFQHHTTIEILRNISDDLDLFTITGTGWHFVKYLGPAVAVVGIDTRSERNPHQVMAGPTYQGLFPKIAMLPGCVQHCILMVPVPVVFPRFEAAESIAQTVATGKKAVTGAYNVLGRVTSSVAGVVGAKGAVASGFDSVKRAAGKSGLLGGVLNSFGDVDVLDDVKDQWTHESKDLERTYFIRTLQGIAQQRSIRFTYLSGAVGVCGAGLVHDPSHPSNYKTIYQLITSPVVDAPAPSYVLKLLGNNKPLYIPANGQRSTPSVPTDTKEDMMEIFAHDVNGQARENRRLLPRRNYMAIVAYDPEVVNGTFGQTDMNKGSGRLSLAADFMVQGEGAFGAVVKFGPVVVPALEYGR